MFFKKKDYSEKSELSYSDLQKEFRDKLQGFCSKYNENNNTDLRYSIKYCPVARSYMVNGFGSIDFILTIEGEEISVSIYTVEHDPFGFIYDKSLKEIKSENYNSFQDKLTDRIKSRILYMQKQNAITSYKDSITLLQNDLHRKLQDILPEIKDEEIEGVNSKLLLIEKIQGQLDRINNRGE